MIEKEVVLTNFTCPPIRFSMHVVNIFCLWMSAYRLPIFDFVSVCRDTYVKEMSGETKNDRNDRGWSF